MAFASPQSVLDNVASRPPIDSSTAYCFAATAKDKPSGGRQIRWDPNDPGCFGVSQDDGWRAAAFATARGRRYENTHPWVGRTRELRLVLSVAQTK